MSYSFRNRPKLSERYRGKSGDEILNELKTQIDEDRKMFFESSPGWNSVQSPGSFSRAGHPLDDMMSRGRQDIRSHLDDLAQRHPEFADHLRCPPWGGEMGATSHGTWGRKRRGSGSSGDDIAGQESSHGPQQSDESSPSRGRSRQNNLPQYGLRNTVDLGQQQQQCEDQEKGRGQRSWSAPPDNRTQNPPDPPRFVSRLDIPVNPMPNNHAPDQGKPPVAPKQQPQQHQPHNSPQQQQHNAPSKTSQQGSTVRHIPIFVEGRDEPLLPRATADAPAEKIFPERVPPHPSTFNYGRPSQFTSRQSQQQSAPHMPQSTPHIPPQGVYNQQAAPPKAKTSAQQQQVPQHHQPPPPPPPPPQQRQESGQQQPQDQPKCTPQPPKPVANDPISRVQAVQKYVDELKVKVDNYSGNSRKDKDYMYLDEMLTRNLLKLDDIETEGKEDLRQARKAVIRNIQQCISILESKVPNTEDGSAVEVEKSSSDCSGERPSGEDVALQSGSDFNKTEVCAEVLEPQKSSDNSGLEMEVENSQEPDAASHTTQLELTVEAVPAVNLDKGSEEQSKSELNPEGMNVEPSITGQMDLPEVPCEKSENVSNKDGESSSQQIKMQVDEKTTENSNDEQMEVNGSCSRETVPITVGKEGSDEKVGTMSPKGDGGSNKTAKTKTPKGSPKKGKRAT